MSYSNGIEHAEQCAGVPVIEQSGHEWSATCQNAYDAGQYPWEVSGCESRAEAGVAFYGARHAEAGTWVFEGAS